MYMEKELQIEQMSEMESISSEFSRYGDDYVFSRIRPDANRKTGTPMTLRIAGLSFLLCRNGNLSIDINLTPHHLKPGTLICIPPQSVLNTYDTDWSELDADMLILSTGFMRSIAIDLSTCASAGIPFQRLGSNTVALTPPEQSMLERYFDLFHCNTSHNTDDTYVRSIARTLMAAIIYQLMQFAASRKVEQEPATAQPFSRRISYVQDFMKLVHEHFRQERSVGFYADKLFISPKYLSLIIKEVTGKSAATWIDDCVILEAKNMLKYSGKNVQQIAYELNFNNQSSFGKYFKHLTGMSPTQFQRS